MKKCLLVSFITISFFANAQWTSLSGPNGAYVRDMERASDGSLYLLSNTYTKSTNGGNSWQAINTSPTGIAFYDLLISGSKFYAVYFSTFYTSSDGTTWTKPANTFPFSSAYKILKFGPEGFLIVYGGDGIFLSKDEGVTWTKILSENVVPNGVPYNNVVATTNGDLYAYSNTLGIRKFPYPGVSGSISESNWQTVLSIPSTSYVSFLASGTTVYASTGNDLRISTNAGSTWSSVKRNITDNQFFGFWGLSPTGVVYYVNNTFSKIYSSTNPSTTDWLNISQPFSNYGASPLTITFETATTYYLGSNGFGILKTTDTGATWSLKNTGLNEASLYNSKVGSTGRIIQFSNFSKGYWESIDNGVTWAFITLSDYVNKSIKLADGTILLYSSRIFKSTDATAASFTTDNVFYSMADIYEASNGDLFGLASSASCTPSCLYTLKLYKSTTKGTSWTDITGTITGLPAAAASLTPYHIAVDASNNLYASAIVNGAYKFYKIVGTSCTDLTTVPFTNYINNLFVQGTKIYAAQPSNYYVSSDQGTTWTTVGFSGDFVFPIRQNTYTGICVSKAGNFYISQDDGQSWNSSSLPSASATITDLDVSSSGVFFASAINSTALRNPTALLVDPTTLPPYINFNWQPLNGPYGGSVGRMRPAAGGLVYAIANGNVLWKYNGTTWSRLTPTAAATPSLTATSFIFDVEVDATGSVYIATNASPKVHKSTDGGITWSALNSTNLVSFPRRIEIFSDGSILAFSGNKIYKSTDGGATFTVKFTGAAPGYTRLPAVSSTEVIATIGNSTEGFVVSMDKGETWTAKTLTTLLDATNGFIGNYMFDNAGNFILTYIQDSTVPGYVAKLAKSANNATSWTATTDPAPSLTGFGRRTIALPTGEYIMTIQNYYDYYRSTDKGSTWTLTGNVGDVFTYAEASGGTTYVQSGSFTSGASGIRGMQKTTDGGVTFTPANAGMPINTANDIEVFNNKDLLVGATSPYYSSDFGQNYQLATSQVAGSFLLLNDTIIGYGSRVLQRSLDGGKTWSPLGEDRFFSFLAKAATGKGFYAFSNSSLPGTTIQFGLFSSPDLVTWKPVTLSGLPTDYFINSMVTDANDAIYAVLTDNASVSGLSDVYKIAFGSAIKINQAIGLSSPTTITYFNNKIYLYDQIGAIFKSTNGDVWTQSTAPAGNSLTITNGYLFVPSLNNTLWLSRDDGGTWQNVGDAPASGVSFRDVAINPYDGYAYATSSGAVTKKSGNMVMPDDKTKPLLLKPTDPVDLATNAELKPVLKFTFDEFTKAVAGKKIRIFDVANQLSPVEIIDISAATIKDKTWSASMTVTLTSFKQYFVTIDAGAVTDIFGNAFLGITANNIWRFTVGDKQAPVITFTPDPLVKGTNNKIYSVGITDDVGVTQAKIFYRSITKSTPEVSANLTLNNSSGKYGITVPEIDFGKMGLEYYFTAQDAAGNSKRSPQSGYHYSYISFSSASPIIPAGLIGVGGGVGNWRMITVPYALADNKVGTIFNELGTSDVTKWRLITYKDQTAWNQFPTNFNNVEQGKGYFINVKELPPDGLNVDGATTPSNNKTAPFVFTLTPGWNQIGNPYNFPMKWSEVLAANGTSAASIGAKLKTFTGTYVDDNDDQLDVFEGAFVLNSGTSSTQITVPIVGSLAGGRKDQSITVSYDLANENWIAPISLKMGDVENAFGGVGMHPQALTSVDSYDDFNPPHFLEYAEISFSHPEHFLKSSTRDVVPTQSEFEWSFTVESNVKSEGEFTWDNTKFGFNTKELFMYDLKKGALIDLRKQVSYRFDPIKSTSFKVYYGEDLEKKIKPEFITLGDAFPNPSKGNITIPFTLPESESSYQVKVEVYDLLGRKASLLDKFLEPGFHSVKWEFSEEQNNGLYIYSIKVISSSKSEVLNKKIILNK
jgi:photosystem II stability/assembly factor-like uncharacterized protein